MPNVESLRFLTHIFERKKVLVLQHNITSLEKSYECHFVDKHDIH